MAHDYVARSKNRAVYLPAGQSGQHNMPHRAAADVRPAGLPTGLTSLLDLDFLDPKNPLFTYDRALFSAGQFLDRKDPKTVREGTFSRRDSRTILTDSGGLQFARDRKVWDGDNSRQWTLDFAETHGDEAITLDIPTLAIGKHPVFQTFDDCLRTTIANNQYWHDHRTTDCRFLSVLQGSDEDEARRWYDGVTALPLGGWAFGGMMRSDYRYLAKVCLRLHREGHLTPERNHIHVLGDSSLTQAVMLSALQYSLREITQDENLLITFDTSSATQTAAWGKVYGRAQFSATKFNMQSYSLPSLHANAGNPTPFPFRTSALAERITVGDLIISSPWRQHGNDPLATELLVNHNTESLLCGIDEANSIMELPAGWKDDKAPPHIIRAYQALRRMHEYPDRIAHLKRSTADFKMLAKQRTTDVEDEAEGDYR